MVREGRKGTESGEGQGFRLAAVKLRKKESQILMPREQGGRKKNATRGVGGSKKR